MSPHVRDNASFVVQPENSSIDHEISVEGLDLSFTRGTTRISPFFSVAVQPPNSRVRLLLERGIASLLRQLSASPAAFQMQGPGLEGQEHRTIHAADDVVVEYIAAVLIKVSFGSRKDIWGALDKARLCSVVTE